MPGLFASLIVLLVGSSGLSVAEDVQNVTLFTNTNLFKNVTLIQTSFDALILACLYDKFWDIQGFRFHIERVNSSDVSFVYRHDCLPLGNSVQSSETKVTCPEPGKVLLTIVPTTMISYTHIVRCSIVDKHEGFTDSKPLELKVSPRAVIFRKSVNEVRVRLLENAILQAFIYAHPAPEFAWFLLTNSGWSSVNSLPYIIEDSAKLESSLTIIRMLPEDFGTYKVTADNNYGSRFEDTFEITPAEDRQLDERECQLPLIIARIVAPVLGGIILILTGVLLKLIFNRQKPGSGTVLTGQKEEVPLANVETHLMRRIYEEPPQVEIMASSKQEAVSPSSRNDYHEIQNVPYGTRPQNYEKLKGKEHVYLTVNQEDKSDKVELPSEATSASTSGQIVVRQDTPSLYGTSRVENYEKYKGRDHEYLTVIADDEIIETSPTASTASTSQIGIHQGTTKMEDPVYSTSTKGSVDANSVENFNGKKLAFFRS